MAIVNFFVTIYPVVLYFFLKFSTAVRAIYHDCPHTSGNSQLTTASGTSHNLMSFRVHCTYSSEFRYELEELLVFPVSVADVP